jgi:hypothetical protein
MADVSELPAKERARYYRKLAGDARREAGTAQADVRNSYLIISEQWERLALTADVDANRES